MQDIKSSVTVFVIREAISRHRNLVSSWLPPKSLNTQPGGRIKYWCFRNSAADGRASGSLLSGQLGA